VGTYASLGRLKQTGIDVTAEVIDESCQDAQFLL
jgi:hypothetical protein